MNLFVVKSLEELSVQAANFIIQEIEKKPDLVLGLATGDTPLRTYEKLIDANQSGSVDFSRVKTFNLDEYVGLDETNHNSYHYYMHHHLFDHVNLKPENIHLLSGISSDYARMAKKYDKLIQENNGIDLQILGIGINGHIGFNEPDSELMINTHVTTLSESTRIQNSKFFTNLEAMPKQAVTMGLGTIMKAKKILLLASGKHKAAVLAKCLKNDVISTDTPASTLMLHPDLTMIIDEEAAELYLKEETRKSYENTYQEYPNFVRKFNII